MSWSKGPEPSLGLSSWGWMAQPMCTFLGPGGAKEGLFAGSGGQGLSVGKQPTASTCVSWYGNELEEGREER